MFTPQKKTILKTGIHAEIFNIMKEKPRKWPGISDKVGETIPLFLIFRGKGGLEAL